MASAAESQDVAGSNTNTPDGCDPIDTTFGLRIAAGALAVAIMTRASVGFGLSQWVVGTVAVAGLIATIGVVLSIESASS